MLVEGYANQIDYKNAMLFIDLLKTFYFLKIASFIYNFSVLTFFFFLQINFQFFVIKNNWEHDLKKISLIVYIVNEWIELNLKRKQNKILNLRVFCVCVCLFISIAFFMIFICKLIEIEGTEIINICNTFRHSISMFYSL